jgi:tetraacyldisaccharide 4'-kinase
VTWIEYFWYRKRPAHLLLVPLSLLFAAASALRRLAYRLKWLPAQRVSVPVVVVGNITVGGTGKTPFVIWLVQMLQRNGYRPGIVTRGYGGSETLQEVLPASDPKEAGDEPVLLSRRTGVPVFASRNRVHAARGLLHAHPDCNVLVSDDGMQHYALGRDVEIAVVDAQRAFGNGFLLPAGPLREPVRRLRTVDAIVQNGDSHMRGLPKPAFRMRLGGEVFVNVCVPERKASAVQLKGQTLHAVAAIGNPQRFFDELHRFGLQFRPHPFPDHFSFTEDDLAFTGKDTVLMTEKDAVKCAAFARETWWFLPIHAEVDAALGELILRQLSVHHGPQAA